MSSLLKGMEVLRVLAEPPFNYTLSELSSTMGMGKSGLHKILSTLKEKNFVVQEGSSKKYHLGPVVLRMGNVYSKLIGIEDIASPVLSNLCQVLGETVYISIWEGDRAYPACKCCRPGGIYDANDFIGKSVPINAGASAKLLAAYQDREFIQGLLLRTELTARTPYTLTSIPEILEEYDRIVKQGYSIEDQSFSLGVWCLSVPIFGKNRAVDRCLSVGAPVEAIGEGIFPVWLQRLRDGADEIGTQLQLRR